MPRRSPLEKILRRPQNIVKYATEAVVDNLMNKREEKKIDQIKADLENANKDNEQEER